MITDWLFTIRQLTTHCNPVSPAIQRSCMSPPPPRQPRIAISPSHCPRSSADPAVAFDTLRVDVYTIFEYRESSSSQRKGGALQRDREELRDTAEDHDDRNREVDDPTRASATTSASIAITNWHRRLVKAQRPSTRPLGDDIQAVREIHLVWYRDVASCQVESKGATRWMRRGRWRSSYQSRPAGVYL